MEIGVWTSRKTENFNKRNAVAYLLSPAKVFVGMSLELSHFAYFYVAISEQKNKQERHRSKPP